MLDKGKLCLPPAANLPNSDLMSNFFFIGDGIFPLQHHLLKPFPGRNLTSDEKRYNYRFSFHPSFMSAHFCEIPLFYRISRARCVVEDFFGMLVAKFRLFHRPMETSLETSINTVKCAVVLLNFLNEEMPEALKPRALLREPWWKNFQHNLQSAEIHVEQRIPASRTQQNLKLWFRDH